MTSVPPRSGSASQHSRSSGGGDEDQAHSADYDGGLRAAAEGGRVAWFKSGGSSESGSAPATGATAGSRLVNARPDTGTDVHGPSRPDESPSPAVESSSAEGSRHAAATDPSSPAVPLRPAQHAAAGEAADGPSADVDSPFLGLFDGDADPAAAGRAAGDPGPSSRPASAPPYANRPASAPPYTTRPASAPPYANRPASAPPARPSAPPAAHRGAPAEPRPVYGSPYAGTPATARPLGGPAQPTAPPQAPRHPATGPQQPAPPGRPYTSPAGAPGGQPSAPQRPAPPRSAPPHQGPGHNGPYAAPRSAPPAFPARHTTGRRAPGTPPTSAPVSGIPISGIPVSGVPVSGAPRAPEDLRGPQRPNGYAHNSRTQEKAAPSTALVRATPANYTRTPPLPPTMVPPARGKRTPLERTPRPKHTDRDPVVELSITEIAGHLTFTPNAVTAWYWLPEVRWAFRPDAEREALLSAISEQFAGLAGFRLHMRRTTRPFAADQWARVVDSNTPHPLPAVGGAPSWADHLVAAQRHLLTINHAEGQTYLGITFARRTLGDTFAERIGRLFNKGVADAERRRMARTVEQFDEVLGAFGMRGRRVTSAELEWLLYRSVALGMSPPTHLSTVEGGRWERGDLLALTEQIERYRTPYGTTVKLVNRLTGEERHVAVLSVGRMEPLEIPERHEPWLHFHERLPWPMELSSRIDILGPGDSFRNLEHRLRLIRSQQLDYAEHGMDAPPELERLAKRALTIGDEITTGLPVDSSRAHGWHRIAVSGRTREECLERARRLTQIYSREMRISLQHSKNQDWLAREFIPGEPLANTGYLRRMPVKLLAAALPQAASTVGDRRGDLVGRTSGTSRRPVFLDLHFPMEVRERSGLAVFVAEPGGGKSTLLGALGYLAARRGVQVTLLDPSGPLARLCAMPELAPFSRVLNLTGSEQGTLAPYALIPTPQRLHFAHGPGGDREFEIAISNARAERRMLVQDIAMMLVPPQVAREASTATLLRHAVRQVPAEETSTLDDVVRELRGMGDDDARELGNLLMDTAEMPLALLFFGSPPPGLLGADATLTVITMAGLRLPDLKIEREYWSAEEALALPMLHTAHRLAVRRCYGGEMGRRKLVGLDEAHFMEGWRSGRSFLVRLARDSRKWNLAALVASQNPRDILGLDVQNLVSTVFVGRIAEDSEIAAEALRLLRVPTDVGYEQTLAALSQVDAASSSRLGFREFVMRDVDGRVQKVRVDVSYVPHLLSYLDTTPVAQGPAPLLDRELDLDLDLDEVDGS